MIKCRNSITSAAGFRRTFGTGTSLSFVRPTKDVTEMTTMWFATDGSRPNSQSGPGIPITTEEVQVIAGLRQAKFVGKDAPSINPDRPSHSLKNVVLEIEANAEVISLLPEVGFYVVANLTPEEAQHALDIHRGRSPE